MANTVKLEVITPSKLFYKGEVEMVVVRTLTGEEGFMANHAWACKLLDVGEMCIQEAGAGDGNFKIAAIANGYVDVKDNIIVYTDAAEWAEDIDMERAKSVKESAQAFLDAHGGTVLSVTPEQSSDIAKAKLELAKAITRMKVASGGGRKR